MILDGIDNLSPLIQVIDNFFKNRKMATLVEAQVGNGKLIICTINLDGENENRPEVRQLKHSILQYMNSSRFAPKNTVSESDLQKLFVNQ